MSQTDQKTEKKKMWIIIASVDFSDGIEADTYEEAVQRAQKLLDQIELPDQIANIELQGVIKA